MIINTTLALLISFIHFRHCDKNTLIRISRHSLLMMKRIDRNKVKIKKIIVNGNTPQIIKQLYDTANFQLIDKFLNLKFLSFSLLPNYALSIHS